MTRRYVNAAVLVFFCSLFPLPLAAESLFDRSVNWLRQGLGLLQEAAPQYVIGLDQQGKVYSLSDFSADYVLINFWASWCQPCREELPAIAELDALYRARGLAVVALNVHDSRDAALAMMAELDLALLYLFDDLGEMTTRYEVNGIPVTYLLNKQSAEVLATWRGKRALKEMQDDLHALFSVSDRAITNPGPTN